MCFIICTRCPISNCQNETAKPHLELCERRSAPFTSVTPCRPGERYFLGTEICATCQRRKRMSTRPRTMDILEDMSFKIPEWKPIPPPKDSETPSASSIQEIIEQQSLGEIRRTPTLAQQQAAELFFDHVVIHHKVNVDNRAELPSQRGNTIPGCLLAGVVGRNRNASTLDRIPVSLKRSKRPSMQIARRAASRRSTSAVSTFTSTIVAQATEQLHAEEHLLPGPSPQEGTFSDQPGAPDVPGNFDSGRRSATLAPSRLQRQDHRRFTHTCAAFTSTAGSQGRRPGVLVALASASRTSFPARIANDVQFPSVRPAVKKKSLKLIPSLQLLTSFQWDEKSGRFE